MLLLRIEVFPSYKLVSVYNVNKDNHKKTTQEFHDSGNTKTGKMGN